MKKIILLIALIFLTTSVLAQDFIPTVLDNESYLNPSVIIDSKGEGHLFWSDYTNLIYSTVSEKETKRIVLFSTKQQLGNIKTTIDKNDTIHLVFSVWNNTYKYYYMNSIDWVVKDLNINYGENAPAITVDSNRTVYIVLVGAQPQQEEDLILVTTTDYNNFDYQWLSKPSVQLNPTIGVDNKGVIHLAFWDWREGVSEGIGLYKIRYTNSLDNFQNETVIAISNQSYLPILKIKEDNVFITFKDAGDSKMGFDGGYIYTADRNSGWNITQIIKIPIKYEQNREVGFSIDNFNVKHFVWTEWGGEETNVTVNYVNSLDYKNQTIQDLSYEYGLGYVSIDSKTTPIIIANIHSTALYELEQEEIVCNCTYLQKQIDELKNRTSNLEAQISLIDVVLGNINEIIEGMKQFPLFKEFWKWYDSPRECFIGETKCELNNKYSCNNYEWQFDKTCQWGCNNGQCNPPPKEDCTTKLSEYKCRYNKYSVEKDYYRCRYGTSTSCEPGHCRYYTDWNWCSNGCNNLTGKCNQ